MGRPTGAIGADQPGGHQTAGSLRERERQHSEFPSAPHQSCRNRIMLSFDRSWLIGRLSVLTASRRVPSVLNSAERAPHATARKPCGPRTRRPRSWLVFLTSTDGATCHAAILAIWRSSEKRARCFYWHRFICIAYSPRSQIYDRNALVMSMCYIDLLTRELLLMWWISVRRIFGLITITVHPKIKAFYNHRPAGNI